MAAFMKSLFLGDLTRDLRYDSNKHENGNKHRPCRLVVTLFVQPSRKWQTVILCICCLLLDCSCKNVNGCHELEIFCFFFLISSSFGINQSEVGFHLLCCDTSQCQNKSCLLLFYIRLGYKLCNIYQQRRSVFTLSEWKRLLCSEKCKTWSLLHKRNFSPTQTTRSLMVIWVLYIPPTVLFGFKSLTILNKTVCCVRKRFSTESLLGKRQLLISSLKVSRSYFHLRALQWVTNTSKMFPNIAFAVIRVKPMYVGTIQKSLVTPLKPPSTMVLKGTVPSGFKIAVFIRSRKWPAIMVREGVTSGSWEIYQSKNQENI